MKKILISAVLPFMIGCSNQEQALTYHASSMYESSLIVEDMARDHPYDLKLELIPTGVEQYDLAVSIELFGGSFFVSPFSTGDFSGKFTLTIEDNSYLNLGYEILESPRSKEVFDPHPFVNGKVNWVQENTRYVYPITLSNNEDFKVRGWIRFTIEPKCTFEEIPFDIICEAGTVRVQQYPKLNKTSCSEVSGNTNERR